MSDVEYGQYEECFAGNSWIRTVHVVDAAEADFDLSICTSIDFYLYNIGTLILHKWTDNGITVTDEATGNLYIRLAPADTTPLLGTYQWELNITTAAADIFTIANGTIVVSSSHGITEPLADSIETLISTISPYTVSDESGSTFTTFEYSNLESKAISILALDNPGFPQNIYDHALALLILHFHEMRLGNTGMKSERLGDYSYTRDGGPNSTGWKIQYDELILKGGEWFTQDPDDLPAPMDRVDESMPEFKLDQSRIKKYDQEDVDYQDISEEDIY